MKVLAANPHPRFNGVITKLLSYAVLGPAKLMRNHLAAILSVSLDHRSLALLRRNGESVQVFCYYATCSRIQDQL